LIFYEKNQIKIFKGELEERCINDIEKAFGTPRVTMVAL
jgi:hypothetical protein